METETSTNPKPNRIAAVTRVDGQVFGRVVMRGNAFVATRKRGQDGVDVRLMAGGFRSLARAVAWVESAA